MWAPCLPLDIFVHGNSIINKRTNEKDLIFIQNSSSPQCPLSSFSISFLHHLFRTLLPWTLCFLTFLAFLIPPPFTPSSFHCLSSSLPLLGSVLKIPAHSDERKNNNTTLQPEEARARDSFRENSETRERSESKQWDQEEISRKHGYFKGEGWAGISGKLGGVWDKHRDTITGPTQTQKSKFCFLGEGAGSGSPVHTERNPVYSCAKDRENCTDGRKQKLL